MNEILFGIRVVKFYAWENHFESKVNELRDAELKSLKGRKYLDAMCVYFWATTPVLISILTFTTYSLMGNQLTAAKVNITYILMLNTLGKFSADDILKYFSYFSLKTGFDVSCKLSPSEKICMKYQVLFSRKNIIILLSAELAQRVVKVSIGTG